MPSVLAPGTILTAATQRTQQTLGKDTRKLLFIDACPLLPGQLAKTLLILFWSALFRSWLYTHA